MQISGEADMQKAAKRMPGKILYCIQRIGGGVDFIVEMSKNSLKCYISRSYWTGDM